MPRAALRSRSTTRRNRGGRQTDHGRHRVLARSQHVLRHGQCLRFRSWVCPTQLKAIFTRPPISARSASSFLPSIPSRKPRPLWACRSIRLSDVVVVIMIETPIGVDYAEKIARVFTFFQGPGEAQLIHAGAEVNLAH